MLTGTDPRAIRPYETELPGQERQYDEERNALPRGKRVSHPQADKTRQQAEILVKGEKGKNRRLPSNHAQFDKQSERRSEENQAWLWRLMANLRRCIGAMGLSSL